MDDDGFDQGSTLGLTVGQSLRNITFASWMNILIVVVPIGYLAHYLHWPVTAKFVLNFFAIIPLSALMGFATEEISLRLGPTWGGLMNASFGNAVELIMAVIALIEEEYRIVQAGLIGSVLSNTLFMLGCAFIAGGVRHRVQIFHAEAAQCAGALLALSVLSMIIPAAYHGVHASRGEITNGILVMSRGTALILLVVYILFLVFQLKTHSDLFDGSQTQKMHDQGFMDEASIEYRTLEPQLKLWIACVLLALVSGLVALSSDILVDSVEELTSRYNISHTFVGMILLPIAANAAEHTMSVTVAIKNKMDLCITVAIGSSMQMALFVLPVLITIAWVMNKPLTLYFDDFETNTMLISVLVINYLIMNGRSNWLKGAMLLSSYFIIALAFFLYPVDVDDPHRSIITPITGNTKQSFLIS
ncbi:calcium/proton exchanger [Linderina pennispora]|uniref:Vacuolar calcium ion transporter n=1 Tax=Linderina pennispora TaxID=61395 RepID=A0A1Y1W854_9FUNG|nr:calcium/proton exchanger [Linderina pennispora]ORX69622.1 calcium/proton exchanger [Linderina pennispora]